MRLLFWRKPEPEIEEEVSITTLSMDAEERESLYRLLHHMDGIELHRPVKYPLERAQEACEIVTHFASRGVHLPWDVVELKQMITDYERASA